MSIEFRRKKRARGSREPHDPTQGRMFVGWRLENWTQVYYRPDIDTQNNSKRSMIDDFGDDDSNDKSSNDDQPEMVLYSHKNRSLQNREPLVSEVSFLAHFDLSNFPSKTKRDREDLRKRFLYDAWRYLAETDPRKIKEMEKSLNKPLSRLWQSWFDLAKKWKKTDLAHRARRRKDREREARAAGLDPKEVEINSDDSEDSTFGDDDEMPVMGPPPHPSETDTAKKRRKSNGPSSRSSPATKRLKTNPVMSGAAGSTSFGRAGAILPETLMDRILGRNTQYDSYGHEDGDDDGDDDAAESVISEMYDERHPTVPPAAGSAARVASESGRRSPLRSNSQARDDGDGRSAQAGIAPSLRTRSRGEHGGGGHAANFLPTPFSQFERRAASVRPSQSRVQRRDPPRHASARPASEDTYGNLKPFDQWGPNNHVENRGSGTGLFVSQEPEGAAGVDTDMQEQDEIITVASNVEFPGNQELYNAMNGEGISEAEALRLAKSMSLAPEENPGAGRSEYEMRGEHENVVQSIEAGAGGQEELDDEYVEGGKE